MLTDLSVGNTDGALEPMNVSTKQGQIAELARRSPAMAITSLNHHLDLDWLRAAFKQTRRGGAVGIDGQTATDYEANLDENLRICSSASSPAATTRQRFDASIFRRLAAIVARWEYRRSRTRWLNGRS